MYAPLVRYINTIIRDSDKSRDLSQDVFIAMWEKRNSLDPKLSIKAYLYRSAKNRALNSIQKDNRLSFSNDLEHMESVEDQKNESETMFTKLKNALTKLPERQRETLEMSRFEGLSHEEIAQVLLISPRTVNNHIVRGLESLRTFLSSTS